MAVTTNSVEPHPLEQTSAEGNPLIREQLQPLIANVSRKIKTLFGRSDEPLIVVSPYRFNPLGAHIDHQGGSVLARTINQYTVLAFYPIDTPRIILHFDAGNDDDKATAFDIGSNESEENWVRYAMASASCVAKQAQSVNGFSGVVSGTLVGAGLSSSASVILAYISALAYVNHLNFEPADLVELVRQVENEHMGLNNGIQDQMSIVFGRENALSLLHMESTTAKYIADPINIDDVCWVICYSGFSRELIKSGFNDRVRECREAANQLDPQAEHLGQVRAEFRDEQFVQKLPEHLMRRVLHVYGESQRVKAGCDAWQAGNWAEFGVLMNQSCQSSISNYECGSDAMIELHQIALKQSGVYGSRFSGGGYGGCLIMLVQNDQASNVMEQVLKAFLAQFPEKRGEANSFIAHAESNARKVSERT